MNRRTTGIILILATLLAGSLLFNGIQATTPTSGPYYLSVPTSTWTYQIGQWANGTYYAVSGDNWRVMSQSTTAATVINYAINGLSGTDHEGIVFIKDGDYTITSTLTIYKKTQLIGEADAVLTLGASVNVITIDSSETTAVCWEIRGFRINCNGQNGNAIYSANAGTTNGWGMPRILNLNIYGVKAGYAAMDLTDIFNMEISDNHIYTSGRGMVFRVNNAKTIDYGNSLIENNRINGQADNTILFDVITGASYQALCLTTITNLQLFADSTYSNTTALKMTGAKHNTFVGGTIETATHMIVLAGCETMQFNNMHAGTGSSVTCVSITGASKRNTFIGGWYYTAAGGTVYDDASTLSTTRNIIDGGCVIGAGTVDLGTNTRLGYCTVSGTEYP